MEKSIDKYIKTLSSLKLGSSKGVTTPHKPVFLLSLCELVEKGLAMDNRFRLDGDLVALFRENAKLLAETSYEPDISRPFYHLQNTKVPELGFWQVHLRTGDFLRHYVSSLNTLDSLVDYASLEEELFDLLLSKSSRERIVSALLDKYFPEKKAAFLRQKAKGEGYAQKLQEQFTREVLNESASSYQPAVQATKKDIEAEEFVRGSLFRKLIPQVYGHTCAITGFKLITDDGTSLLDACHIVPFSKTKDDRISNGLALCPNLHRAFDRGWIAVDESYRVLVSDCFAESENHNYSLRSLQGRQLILPFGKKHHPTLGNLAWHREYMFRG